MTILNKKGFTMIELLVVFATLVIVGTVGIASFSNYNQSQTVQQAASDIFALLNVAKSRTASQTKTSGCVSGFQGYQVQFTSNTVYELDELCPTPIVIQQNTLPNAVTFTAPSSYPTSAKFYVITGASSNTTIKVKGYGIIHTITVDLVSNISMN